MQKELLEGGSKLSINFKKLKEICGKIIKNGNFVIPVVVQDINTKEVLILAYLNRKALKYSLENRVAAFWSTSRNELWVKGVASGNTLELVEVRINCEQNSFLFMVKPRNNCGACHTKDRFGGFRKSCFYRRLKNLKELEFIE